MLLTLSVIAPSRSPAGAAARARPRAEASTGTDATAAPEARREEREKEEPPIVTRHEARLGGRALRYTVTTGMMPLKNEAGETEANIFYMAYVADRPGGPEKRPLTFSFNGGPGSSSVWLHLGALGPGACACSRTAACPRRPTSSSTTTRTWLDLTDLVFIDPVGTGYSRPKKPELGKKFWGVEGDIQSVGEFIRLYLSRHERWASPLFLVGESYGTTRAAGLSGHLVDRGIALNGIMLVSSILNFQTARFTRGNDTPYPLFLPTYAATAWYHRKLPADLQAQPLRKVLDEVERWAGGRVPGGAGQGRPARGRGARGGRGPARRATRASTRTTSSRATCASRSSTSARSCCATASARWDGSTAASRGSTRRRPGERPDYDPEPGRHPAALHGDLQRLRPPRRSATRRDLDVLHPRRRHRHAVGLGHGQRLRRRERGAARRVRQEPGHAAVRRLRLLRPGHAVLRDRLHAEPPRPRSEPARAASARRSTRPAT